MKKALRLINVCCSEKAIPSIAKISALNGFEVICDSHLRKEYTTECQKIKEVNFRTNRPISAEKPLPEKVAQLLSENKNVLIVNTECTELIKTIKTSSNISVESLNIFFGKNNSSGPLNSITALLTPESTLENNIIWDEKVFERYIKGDRISSIKKIETIIMIAFDFSMTSTGVACLANVNSTTKVLLGKFSSPVGQNDFIRGQEAGKSLKALIMRDASGEPYLINALSCQDIIVEGGALSAIHGAYRLGRYCGMIMGKFDIKTVTEVPPTRLKKCVAGKGFASKESLKIAALKMLDLPDNLNLTDDESDALGLLAYKLNESKFSPTKNKKKTKKKIAKKIAKKIEPVKTGSEHNPTNIKDIIL